MIILGIDPGYERLGIAVLSKENDNQKEIVLFSECFKTEKKLPHHKRLFLIGKEINSVIKKYSPEKLAIETLFFNSNQMTAMKVAEARGVILYEASRSGLNIFEYTPLQIKIAVTGYGRSDKKQMIDMLNKLILIKKPIKHDDEYDAIASAITCFACEKNKISTGK